MTIHAHASARVTNQVQLTWDETDHERVTAMNRKFNKDELLDMDFNAYLASSSEEEEGEGGTADSREGGRGEGSRGEPFPRERAGSSHLFVPQVRRPKRRRMRSRCVSTEICSGASRRKRSSCRRTKTWRWRSPGCQVDTHLPASPEPQRLAIEEMRFNLPSGLKETTEQLVKKKLEEQNVLTPWEEFLQKKKGKKKLKKCQRKQVSRAAGHQTHWRSPSPPLSLLIRDRRS